MKAQNKTTPFFIMFLLLFSVSFFGQESVNKRKIHYVPEGNSFVLKNGTRKFNRALYGSNTGFRVETGDLPEFAMYMPGMGGNFKLGLINGGESKWITEALKIETKYVLGTMQYEIQDPILGNGKLILQVVALKDKEGFIVKAYGENLPQKINLIWAFGGASGKKFSRDGDIGADPESVFYLQPDYCLNNKYALKKQSFLLEYGSESNKQKTGNNKSLVGYFPVSDVKLGNAKQQKSPLELYHSSPESLILISGKSSILKNDLYWLFASEAPKSDVSQKGIAQLYDQAVRETHVLANRVKVVTPDPYINTLGSALSIAADGIWENPAYLHGAIAWRMYLNAWRGAYTADPLGWHDRAKTHFASYSNSQVTSPQKGPIVLDTVRNFARQKEVMGTSMFSSGYISRNPNKNTVAHHYDMNLVFFDQMLRHFKWTGDTGFMKEMWPVIMRHLDWEKRNFDPDHDGLYDAYATIWASDALQYSGGGVIHSTAYNYYANKIVAETAKMINKDEIPFLNEADKILKASKEQLWIPKKGIFAEYKDALGNRLLHDKPAIWSIYHTIDSELSNPFESYQMLSYVNTQIPHIPISVDGLEKKDLYMISTTNWQPYTWSINNVALAEQLHTSLAFWQGGQSEKAFKMWESALVESMYLGASPGGFEQLVYQDAMRGELYRDFADPIGMVSRTLVEGLFGIQPDALAQVLTIKPGFPSEWNNASLDIPDIAIDFKRESKKDFYHIENRLSTKMNLKLVLNTPFDEIESITANGKIVDYKIVEESIGNPKISIELPYSSFFDITIIWKGNTFEPVQTKSFYTSDGTINFTTKQAEITDVYDPQTILAGIFKSQNDFRATLKGQGNSLFFLKLKQGAFSWWEPVEILFKPNFEITSEFFDTSNWSVSVKNNFNQEVKATLLFNDSEKSQNELAFKINEEKKIDLSSKRLLPGTNSFEIKTTENTTDKITFTNWEIPYDNSRKAESVLLTTFYNSKVTDVFNNVYLSPRPQTVTLQLPTNGIGNWCYPNVSVKIDDSGLREKAKLSGEILTPNGFSFKTPSDENQKNVIFTSQWDNFPKSVSVPLHGKASHIYFMVAGTTNPMQSRMVNGVIEVYYTDGTSEILELKNPENWWPIEQDYFVNGLAFTTDAPKPPRVYLKTGEISRTFKDFVSIKGFSNYGIDGGAATILDLPLNKNKTLKNMTIKAIANDVVIGLMSATLIR